MGRVSSELDSLFRSAVNCHECFEARTIGRSRVDVAQPRLIGSKYWKSQKRILVMMINPGSGETRQDGADELHRELIQLYRLQQGTLEAIFEHQRRDLKNWGRFVSFYCSSLGLYIEELAFGNIAWCSTVGNRYPDWMLQRCFERHSSRLVQLLDPRVILMSGTSVHCFAPPIHAVAPNASVILTPHYAHREGKAFEEREAKRIRAEMSLII